MAGRRRTAPAPQAPAAPNGPPPPPPPAVDPVAEFARAVVEGRRVAGPSVRAACRRHLDDLEHALARGWVFDQARATRALRFFPTILRLNGGRFEGQPFALADWQAFAVGSLFGWIGTADGRRRFRRAYMETGKGSGKSPLAAGIGLMMLVADGEPRSEIYAAASKKEQALVMFRDAVAMVQLSPTLSERLRVIGGVNPWNIIFGGSFFRPIASDEQQSGPRPHGVLIDELHEHRDDTVIELLSAGFKFREQPLLLAITNAGVDRTSVCWQYHQHALHVAAGVLEDDRFFSYVCDLDEGEDPLEDESCWIKTNPSLGVTIGLDYLRDQVHAARQMPAKESKVRRLHFCQWVDAASPWISGDAWRACERDLGAPMDAADIFAERDVILAVDLSATTDLTALAIVAEDASGWIDAAVEFWTPGDTLAARSERDSVPYELWRDQGWLHALPGQTIDYDDIARRIDALLKAGLRVRSLVFDRYRMGFLRRALEALGLTLPLLEHPQGFVKIKATALWMPQSINELEAAVLQRTLRVVRNPVLTWNSASAVVVKDEQESRVFSKRRSTGRIDGLVALAMGVGAVKAPAESFDVEAWIA
jgi:phage terminase large subunit-like protein